MKNTITILGSGFSSLASACYLAKSGYDVTIFEKNSTIGGRARQLKKEGFIFDIGPTWYWMPDVFERFFNDFSKKPSDYYQLEKLNPAYSVYFDVNDYITIEDSIEKICKAFEKEEVGSSRKLMKFIDQAKDNYNIAIKDLVYNPGVSPLELVNIDTIKKLNNSEFTIAARTEHISGVERINVNDKYFNAGVMVIDFEKWQKKDFHEQLIHKLNDLKNNIVHYEIVLLG